MSKFEQAAQQAQAADTLKPSQRVYLGDESPEWNARFKDGKSSVWIQGSGPL